MKESKNTRKDNLSPVENGSKRIYKMYKSKKSWVVAPVVLATLLTSVGAAPLSVLAASDTPAVSAQDTLSAAKADGLEKLESFTNLTDAQKTSFTDRINATTVTTVAAVVAIVEEAADADVKVDVDAATATATEATTTINALENITNATYTARVTTALAAITAAQTKFAADYTANFENDNYEETREAFDAVLTAQTAAIASAVTAAQTESESNTSYDAKLTASTAAVNALAELTPAERDNYISQLKAVENAEGYVGNMDTIVTAARTANQKKITDAKAEAQALLDGQTVLTTNQKTEFQKQVDAITSVAGATTVKTAIQAAIDEATGASALATAKAELIAKINADSELTASEKQTWIDRANAAATVDAVNSIASEYNDLVAARDLASLKTTVKTGIAALEGSLTEVEVANYQAQVDQAENSATVLSIRDAVNAVAASRLETAKTNANATINGLTNLSTTDRNGYLEQVKNATLADDVNAIAEAAKTADTAAALTNAKTAATQQINGLTYLPTADKNTYLEDVKTATTVAAINDIVSEAVYADYLAGIDQAVELEDAKAIATDAINAFPSLTAAEKEAAIADVNAATTNPAVAAVVALAKDTNDNNAAAAQAAAELAAYKTDKVKVVNALGYLTDAQKADYVAQINAAANTADVDTIVQNATTANSEAQAAAEALEAAKSAAITEVTDELTNLTDDQIVSYVAQILAATTVDSVDTIMSDARETNINQTTDIEEYREFAMDLIAGYDGLTPAQVIAYQNELTQGTTLDELKATVADAYAVHAPVHDAAVIKKIDALIAAGNLETAKLELANLLLPANVTEQTNRINGLLELRSAKQAARDEINAADYLNADQKADYLTQVNNATSVSAVNAILTEIRDLAPATAVPVYRLYNPYSYEHLFTINAAEKDNLVSLGWNYEGIGWQAASKGTAVYRLYNQYNGEHLYTTDLAGEYENLGALGWTQEGIAFYSDDEKGVNVYRLFNPYETVNTHHYATSTDEVQNLVSLGWVYEGISLFGMK